MRCKRTMAAAVMAAALLGVAAAQADPPAAAPTGPTYYIAADQIDWSYAPSGVNLCTGEAFDGAQAGLPGRPRRRSPEPPRGVGGRRAPRAHATRVA